MPDVVDLIKAQHRTMDALLEQAQEEGADTKALLRQVADLLLPHSKAEEAFVYPSIREHDASEAEEVADGAAEHHHIEGLMTELLEEDADGPGYDGKLAAMIGELRHHVEEEEQDLLTVLSEKASDAERDQLGARFAAETGDARTDVPDTEGTPDRHEGSPEHGHDATKAELYEQAKEKHVTGRSSMSKEELAEAVEKA